MEIKMTYAIVIAVGYLLGTLSPAALISKIKNVDLRERGTGNLGATNTLLVFGKLSAAIVVLFDMFKAMVAFRIAKLLLPDVAIAGFIGGGAAILGHIFPFYLKFKGGKGLASFAGLVLAYDPPTFFILLVITMTLMLIVNYSAAVPMSASVLFPVMAGLNDKSVTVFLAASLVCGIVAFMHRENLIKAKNGTDIKVRDCIRNMFSNEEEKKKRW